MMTKELYIEEMQKYWGASSMIGYCIKEFSNLCEFADGHYLVFTKPSITTRFCFGYDRMPGSYDNANEMCAHVKKNEVYFITENMKKINEKIDALKRYEKIFIQPAYFDQPDDMMICSLLYLRCFEEPAKEAHVIRELTQDDKDRIIKTLEEEKTKFNKRLKTYLKRYGLSKLDTWTYDRDY